MPMVDEIIYNNENLNNNDYFIAFLIIFIAMVSPKRIKLYDSRKKELKKIVGKFQKKLIF